MRALMVVIAVVIIGMASLGTISSGLADQTNQGLNQMFAEVATSNENDMQNALAALGKAQTLTPAAFAAIATPSPVSLCSSDASDCNLTTTTTVALSTSNGVKMAGANTAVTNTNANSTLKELDVEVVFTMNIVTADGSVATATARKTWAVTDQSPYAVPMASSTNQAHGELGGGANYDNPTIGCNNTTGSGCAEYSATTYEADTRLHVAPTCPATYDPTECSGAGTSIPSDAYSAATYTVTH